MHKRDIDVLLAGTKPNVEYLTDVEWMRWFDKENFITEDGENYAAAFVGLPKEESDGAFYVAPSTQTGNPENWKTKLQVSPFFLGSFGPKTRFQRSLNRAASFGMLETHF